MRAKQGGGRLRVRDTRHSNCDRVESLDVPSFYRPSLILALIVCQLSFYFSENKHQN